MRSTERQPPVCSLLSGSLSDLIVTKRYDAADDDHIHNSSEIMHSIFIIIVIIINQQQQ
jgi:hypothetical protein